MAKVSESKRRANDKWDKNNRERKNYITKRSVARNFFKNMETEDIPEFKELLSERIKRAEEEGYNL